jgi:galactonate dehydratase
MHLAASVPNFFILEQMEPQRALRDRASDRPIELRDGHFVLPDRPGLGVEPNLEFLSQYPYRPQPRSERGEALYR